MSKEYRIDKEYSVGEIIQYNLRKWWLAVICAVICAAVLGGYKYTSLHPFVEKEIYEDKQQAIASMFVSDYSDTSVVERASNVMKIAKSSRAYEQFCKNTKMPITMDEYTGLFEAQQTEASGIVSVYVTFPVTVGGVSLMEEESAINFANAVMEATITTCNDVIGVEGVSILDAPYVTREVVKIENYSITEDDFQRSVLKALTAGVLLGIIVEVVVFTFWMLLYKKPKNAEEIRQALDADIMDVLKDGEDNENGFKKVSLFLSETEASCNKINCITLQCPKKDVALKLAMSYANEQKKTLYIDTTVSENVEAGENAISKYVLGEADEVKPLAMSEYLDAVCRNYSDEKGMDIVGNKKFAAFIAEMEKKYECIVINSADATKAPEAYAVSKFCNKTFLACGRKNVKNEELYRAKNILDVNEIRLDGVLVYDL